MLWRMLRGVEAAAAETARVEETEAVLVEVERVEQVERWVQISTAEEAAEAAAKDPWWHL